MTTVTSILNISQAYIISVDCIVLDPQSDTVISDGLIIILKWIIYTFVCQLINGFGVVTNVINMICFIKQGFKDTTNICLMGLAVSDLGSLVTVAWTNLCMNPEFSTSGLGFDTVEVQYMTGAMPHFTFTRITAWITAVITVERCLCITMPLKVRHIVTHKRMIVTLTAIYLFSFVTIAPLYVVNRLDLKFYSKRNKTLIGLVSTDDRAPVDKFLYGLNNVAIPVLLFLVVIICTTFLVIKLHSKAEWRRQSTNSSQADTVSKRNKRVAKMVVMISGIFIACFIPVSITFLGMCLEPGLSVDGTYRNTLVLIGGVCIFSESLNSSVNIFIYYSMSRNYRDTFHQMFHFKDDKCNIHLLQQCVATS